MDSISPKFRLYPEIEPYDSGFIDLDGYHKMYWETSGKPNGVPVVFLHGGPGAGASSSHRRFFDPEFYRIIVFDQRGSGRSLPFADINNNTTQHLLSDIETLRNYLKIEKWLVFGGSWGSSLALAHGIESPERVTGLILRGIFLCRSEELNWFLNGMRAVFPENWEKFVDFLPENERGEVLLSYYRRLKNDDPKMHLPAAQAWAQYESSCSTLLPGIRSNSGFAGGKFALALSRIEAHYFMNNMFLEDDYFISNAGAIRNIPTTIIQGRYDMVCPVKTAFELSKALPRADFRIIPDAGHSAMEPSICAGLVAATDGFKTRVR